MFIFIQISDSYIIMDKLEFPQEIPPGLGFKLAGSLVMHPLEVAKVLIQVGLRTMHYAAPLANLFKVHIA